MSNGNYRHDPQAVLDYSWDWAEWLPAGDSIASYVVTPGTGVTVNSHSRDGAVITAWIEVDPVLVGQQLTATCHVVTAAGREDDRTKRFLVIER